MKKVILSILCIYLVFSLIGCAKKEKQQDTPLYPDFKIALAVDEGGVEDNSFNQSAWDAAKDFAQSTGAKVIYQEANGKDYYYKNFEILAEEGYDIIWCLGYNMQSEMLKAAKDFPDQLFAIVDPDFDFEIPKNVISISFAAQESSFISGYIGGKTTKTNNLGFVKGTDTVNLNAFEFGFKAGVATAAKEIGKNLNVYVECIDTFNDVAAAENAATKLINNYNCDIIHQCAGAASIGVTNICKQNGIYAIGVDKDQNFLAPETILTSSIKHVGSAVYTISLKIANGDSLGGTRQILGIESGCTGVCPTSDKTVPKDIMDNVYIFAKKIKSKEIVPPATQEEFDAFLKTL
ncbi:MAG: BMP family ABC transporter substrate-binding protein [Oscillospiraceae bacterium]